MLKKLGISTAIILFLLSSVTVWGLAPGNPDLFIQVTPTSQDVSVGGSASFTVSVISQEGLEDKVQLSVADPPAGVTVTFNPNPVDVPAFAQGDSQMTVTAASGAATGSATLKIVGKALSEGVERSKDVTVNIVGGGGAQEPPVEQPPVEPPPGEAVTSTVTTTTTVTTTIVSTVTEVITTKTSPVSTKTDLSGFDQANELTLPVVTLVVVIILLAVAAITLRKRD